MVMTIEAAMKWIHGRSLYGARPGLERVEALLQRIGNPEKRIHTIHIAGTNGKGSTVTYLRCILEELGLKVGTFISPHVTHYNEQIAINGEYISEESIVKYVVKYQNIVEEMDQEPQVAGITEFETVTVIALDYFFNEHVDVAIIEVGMGGLLDSTNVVCPMLTAITTIGKDHTDFLGETVEEIATHKAGIIKPNIPVITGNIEASPLKVIKNVAAKNNSKTYRYGEDFKINYCHPDKEWGEVFNFTGINNEFANLKISLSGRHQCENAAVAIQLFILYCQFQEISLVEQHVFKGLAKALWPARMEKVSTRPLIVLDGAHNDHAVQRLADNLQNNFPTRTKHVLFSSLSTKNFDLMIRILKKVPDLRLYLTTFEFPKAVELTKLEKYLDTNTKLIPIWRDGIEEILGNMSTNDLMLATGSLYFLSQVRPLMLAKFNEKCEVTKSNK